MAHVLQFDSDAKWFSEHRDRKTRIRDVVGSEKADEFASLGDHDYARRRIIAVRVPQGRGWAIMAIPFLAFSDESIEDDDATLLPIVDGIMRRAAEQYGIKTPPRRY